MPGNRDRNFRGGDLSEGLGLEMLRPFAYIAPVPRTEDIGFDAVATLQRRNGRQLYAEDSFVVQVKAASVRVLEFEGEKLDWLRSLSLPFYLMSVDRQSFTMELRSIVRASTHFNYRDRKAITLNLDETPFDITGDRMSVWLGPPILRWTAPEANDPTYHQTVYEVLKAWIRFEMENISLRPLGMMFRICWETNQIPQPTGSFTIASHPREFQSVLEALCPQMQWLGMHVFGNRESSDDLLIGLLHLTQFMRRHGVDPDPGGLLPLIAKVRAEEKAKQAQAG